MKNQKVSSTHINNMWVGGNTPSSYNLEKVEISFCIDWITATFKDSRVLENLTELKPLDTADKLVIGKEPEINEYANVGLKLSPTNIKFWKQTYDWFKGAKVSVGMNGSIVGEGRDKMVMITLSGKPLLHLRKKYGLTSFDILRWFYQFMEIDRHGVQQGKFTRIDYAIDIFPKESGFSILDESLFHIHHDSYTTTAKDNGKIKQIFERVKSDNQLQTIYVGSRKSETFVRIYDKRKEQISNGMKDPGQEWHRFEFETKQSRCSQIVDKVMESFRNGQNWHEQVCGIIKKFLNFRDLEEVRVRSCAKFAKTAYWWDYILKNTEAISLPSILPEPKPLDQKQENDLKQIAKRFFGLTILATKDKKDLANLLKKVFKRGEAAYRCDDYQVLLEYIENSGIQPEFYLRREMVKQEIAPDTYLV